MVDHKATSNGSMVRLVNEMDTPTLLRGWESFSPLEKEFLTYLPWIGTRIGAAKAMGKNEQWVQGRQRQNPLFKEAVEFRSQLRTQIVRELGKDALGQSMMRLIEKLAKDYPSQAIQMKAIEHLHKIMGISAGAGIGAGPTTGERGAFINTQMVNMFKTDTEGYVQFKRAGPQIKPIEASVIEAEEFGNELIVQDEASNEDVTIEDWLDEDED